MAKTIILYDTTNGAILQKEIPLPVRTVLSSGSGSLSELDLTGIDLDGNAQGDVDWIAITKDGKTMRRYAASWTDDTHIVLKSAARILDGDVTWELMSDSAAVQFTAQEKATRIADKKTEVGHDDVDALLITTDTPIDSSWQVNTTTSQLEKKTADITYE